MISIIVSSYNEEYFNSFVKNVETTIGDTSYEIIRILNPGIMGICEAYNNGANQARFEALAFVHEDLEFITHNWGKNLIDILKNPDIGVVGVAGSVYKTKTASGWYHFRVGETEFNRLNIIQNFKFENQKPDHWYVNPLNEKYSKVISLDGVFMGVQKKIWENIRFDESIDGFHAYDLDFTLAVGKTKQNIVTYDILISHKSEGSNSRDWIIETLKVNRKFIDEFPKSCIKIDGHVRRKLEFKNLICMLDIIRGRCISKKDQLQLIFKFLSLNKSYYFSPKAIFQILYSLR